MSCLVPRLRAVKWNFVIYRKSLAERPHAVSLTAHLIDAVVTKLLFLRAILGATPFPGVGALPRRSCPTHRSTDGILANQRCSYVQCPRRDPGSAGARAALPSASRPPAAGAALTPSQAFRNETEP